MFKWLYKFLVKGEEIISPPRRRPRPDYACTNHFEDDPPPYCHRCPDGWNGKGNKPTLFRPDPNRYDQRLCLDWICEDCEKREKERKEFWIKRYNDTEEGAKLAFHEKDGVYYFEYVPIEADFEVNFSSLAPYVKRLIDAADNYFKDGLDFDVLIIREGKVYTRCDGDEWLWPPE